MVDNKRHNQERVENLEFDEDDFGPDNKFADENLYKYHPNTERFVPAKQPFSYFYVTITGQIEFGEFMGQDGLAVKYEFVAGNDWYQANGEASGFG